MVALLVQCHYVFVYIAILFQVKRSLLYFPSQDKKSLMRPVPSQMKPHDDDEESSQSNKQR